MPENLACSGAAVAVLSQEPSYLGDPSLRLGLQAEWLIELISECTSRTSARSLSRMRNECDGVSSPCTSLQNAGTSSTRGSRACLGEPIKACSCARITTSVLSGIAGTHAQPVFRVFDVPAIHPEGPNM